MAYSRTNNFQIYKETRRSITASRDLIAFCRQPKEKTYCRYNYHEPLIS